MWAIAAITLVGFMMIISSIPQDAFAVKETRKLSLTVVDGDVKVKNAFCIATSDKNDSREDNSGNSGKVSFTFPNNPETVIVICIKDNGNEPPGTEITFPLDGKHTRLIFLF